MCRRAPKKCLKGEQPEKPQRVVSIPCEKCYIMTGVGEAEVVKIGSGTPPSKSLQVSVAWKLVSVVGLARCC